MNTNTATNNRLSFNQISVNSEAKVYIASKINSDCDVSWEFKGLLLKR